MEQTALSLPDLPRDREALVEAYVEMSRRLFVTTACLGDLVDAVASGSVDEELLEKAQAVLGRERCGRLS